MLTYQVCHWNPFKKCWVVQYNRYHSKTIIVLHYWLTVLSSSSSWRSVHWADQCSRTFLDVPRNWFNFITDVIQHNILKSSYCHPQVSSSAMATSRRNRNWHPTMNCVLSTSRQILPTSEDDGVGQKLTKLMVGPTAGGLPTVFRVPIRNWIVPGTTHTRQQWIFATWDTWNSVYWGTSRHGSYYAWCWYLSDLKRKVFVFFCFHEGNFALSVQWFRWRFEMQ